MDEGEPVESAGSSETITGKVMLVSSSVSDRVQPLDRALVSVDLEEKRDMTDENGKFGINAPNGRYCLTVSFSSNVLGYKNPSSFSTWIEVSDSFHPDLVIPIRTYDDGIVIYEAMLTDANIGDIDSALAKTIFPGGTNKVYMIMQYILPDADDVIDLVWLKGAEEVNRIRCDDLATSSADAAETTRFSVSTADGIPEGRYSIQLQYRKLGDYAFGGPKLILSLPFYVMAKPAGETPTYTGKKFSITVINKRDESIDVHLDGKFKFSLDSAEFEFMGWNKKTMKDVPGGEHTITVFDANDDLITSETFVLDSDMTLTINPGFKIAF